MLLKIGVSEINVVYGLIIRSFAAFPLLIILSLLFNPQSIWSNYFASPVFFLALGAGLLLICADYLVMFILKIKPVGIIAPLISTFPIFTTALLLIFGQAEGSFQILFFTGVVMIGVFLVTIKVSAFTTVSPEQNGLMARLKSFDYVALGFGITIALILGTGNFLDILALNREEITGVPFSAVKFSIVFIGSWLLFFALGSNLKDFRSQLELKRATKYLLLAGLFAWFLGSITVYTAFDNGDPLLINPIIGANPLFTVVISKALGMEDLSKWNYLGAIICVGGTIGLVM